MPLQFFLRRYSIARSPPPRPGQLWGTSSGPLGSNRVAAFGSMNATFARGRGHVARADMSPAASTPRLKKTSKPRAYDNGPLASWAPDLRRTVDNRPLTASAPLTLMRTVVLRRKHPRISRRRG